MTRKQLSIFFLTLFIQAIIYPAVIFNVYVELGDESMARTLPVDFPDNGNSCYFGLNNNEEETSGENPAPIFQQSFHHNNFRDLDAMTKIAFGLAADVKSAHLEITTPPPKVF